MAPVHEGGAPNPPCSENNAVLSPAAIAAMAHTKLSNRSVSTLTTRLSGND